MLVVVGGEGGEGVVVDVHGSLDFRVEFEARVGCKQVQRTARESD